MRRAPLRDPTGGPDYRNRQWLLGIGCARGRSEHAELAILWELPGSPSRRQLEAVQASRSDSQQPQSAHGMGAWLLGCRLPPAVIVCFLDSAEGDLVRL
jgi:hypothetical protein